MDVLVDTNVFLWLMSDETRLSPKVRRIAHNPSHVLVFSAAVGWEIVIKVQIGKLQLPDLPSRYIPARVAEFGMRNLPVDLRHVLLLESLPLHHRDPFDRVLAAQSHAEALPILTADPVFEKYDVEAIW
jgi:PIN domain nuclease of toxin-antitoxin system